MTHDVDRLAELVHRDWIATKTGHGVVSRTSETGEELMVPWSHLSEAAKDLDRNTVRTVLAAIAEAGWSAG